MPPQNRNEGKNSSPMTSDTSTFQGERGTDSPKGGENAEAGFLGSLGVDAVLGADGDDGYSDEDKAERGDPEFDMNSLDRQDQANPSEPRPSLPDEGSQGQHASTGEPEVKSDNVKFISYAQKAEKNQPDGDFKGSESFSPSGFDYREGSPGVGDYRILNEGADSPTFSDHDYDDYDETSNGELPLGRLRNKVQLTAAERYCGLKPKGPTVLYTPPGVRPDELEALDLFAVTDAGFFELLRDSHGDLVCPERRRGERVLFRNLRLKNSELVGDMVYSDPRSYRHMTQVHPDGKATKTPRAPTEQKTPPRREDRGSKERSKSVENSGKKLSMWSRLLCKVSKRYCNTKVTGEKGQDEDSGDPTTHKRQPRQIVAAEVPLREVFGVKPLEIFDWKVKELLYRLDREMGQEGNLDERMPPYFAVPTEAAGRAPGVAQVPGSGSEGETISHAGALQGDFQREPKGGDAERRRESHETQNSAGAGRQAPASRTDAPVEAGQGDVRRLSEQAYNDNPEKAPEQSGGALDGGVDYPANDWLEAEYEDAPNISIPDFLFSVPADRTHDDDEPNTMEQEATSVDLKVTVLCLENGAPPILIKEWPAFTNVVKPRKVLPQKPAVPRKSVAVWGSSFLAAVAAGMYAIKRLVNPAALQYGSRYQRLESFSLLGWLAVFVLGSAQLAGLLTWNVRTAIHSSHLRHNLREELFADEKAGTDGSAGSVYPTGFIFYYDRHFRQSHNS
ncbi:hypothetical protein TGGT1_254470 [Toxoplasma gondii GT1]|nr:hypothetical protein TGGT1_254470 [Toxoplasma gondii GT1]KFG53035.1 putative transmembrane protein [Toxoplasma gondii FOU]KFH06697.1 putative transmembrane protein [Toxoplasma gondii VAND]RQX68549.1 putative transmembrane protein [Toxoplasma gondii CAST]